MRAPFFVIYLSLVMHGISPKCTTDVYTWKQWRLGMPMNPRTVRIWREKLESGFSFRCWKRRLSALNGDPQWWTHGYSCFTMSFKEGNIGNGRQRTWAGGTRCRGTWGCAWVIPDLRLDWFSIDHISENIIVTSTKLCKKTDVHTHILHPTGVSLLNATRSQIRFWLPTGGPWNPWQRLCNDGWHGKNLTNESYSGFLWTWGRQPHPEVNMVDFWQLIYLESNHSNHRFDFWSFPNDLPIFFAWFVRP